MAAAELMRADGGPACAVRVVAELPVAHLHAHVYAALTPAAARYERLVILAAELLAERLRSGDLDLPARQSLGLCAEEAQAVEQVGRRLGITVIRRQGTRHDPVTGQRLEPVTSPHWWSQLRNGVIADCVSRADAWMIICAPRRGARHPWRVR